MIKLLFCLRKAHGKTFRRVIWFEEYNHSWALIGKSQPGGKGSRSVDQPKTDLKCVTAGHSQIPTDIARSASIEKPKTPREQ